VTGADIIVHVRDMANPAHAAQKKQVLDVLADLEVVDRDTGAGGKSRSLRCGTRLIC